jgi:hypothetical protein
MAEIWKYTLSAAEMAKEEIEYGIFQQRSRCNADSCIHVWRKLQCSDADHYLPHYLHHHAAHLEFSGDHDRDGGFSGFDHCRGLE